MSNNPVRHKPTTYDLIREHQVTPYAETVSTSAGGSTFDRHQEHLTVAYQEPAATSAPTTHDLVSARLTVEAARNKPGDTQVQGGIEYVFDGDSWIPVEQKS